MVASQTFGVINSNELPTLGSEWLRWELERCGARIVPPKEADIVCISALSPQVPSLVKSALKKNGVEPLASKRIRQLVVLGGGVGLAPKSFDPFVDLICVGEGRAMVRSLVKEGFESACRLPNAWVPNETREVVPDLDFPWDCPPIQSCDGVVRIFGSRGCQKKCLFCHTGWSVTYRKTDKPIQRMTEALRLRGKTVGVVTNDIGDFPTIDLSGQHASLSYSRLRTLIREGRMNLAGVKLGVEAPSERLRKAIGKPINTQDLYEVSVGLLNRGVIVRWLLIAGLPGEIDSDYDELKSIIPRAKHEIKKGMLQVSFTAFCPESSTPLGLLPLTDDYWKRNKDFFDWFFMTDAYTSRVRLFRCSAPKGRLEHAMGAMGCGEEELRRGWKDKDPPNCRIRYAYRDIRRQACKLYCERVGLTW